MLEGKKEKKVVLSGKAEIARGMKEKARKKMLSSTFFEMREQNFALSKIAISMIAFDNKTTLELPSFA